MPETFSIRERIRQWRAWRALPASARDAHRKDEERSLSEDPGIPSSIECAMGWLCDAQSHSTSQDGGVARHFSVIDGWGPSYPETTGYIIPTFISESKRQSRDDFAQRALTMLHWLREIQLPEGGFQGGTIVDRPVVPVTFNTGQILIGLAAGAEEFGEPFLTTTRQAASWLAGIQDRDGCWRKYESPFARSGDKVYDTHVAWGMLEAGRVTGDEEYTDAGVRNIRWAMSRQHPNGWFQDCCLTDPVRPLTHTIGYALRGIIEGYLVSEDTEMLTAALKTADGLANVLAPDGFLPGRLDSDWRATVGWSCLTGTVQIAHCWLQLFSITGRDDFLESGRRANGYVRRTLATQAPPGIRGGVRGSYPISGDYGQYQYLNWAAKFFVDSNVLEQELIGHAG